MIYKISLSHTHINFDIVVIKIISVFGFVKFI